MNSAHISKVEKARNYAEDKGRVTIASLTGTFRGNHNNYQVSFDDGQWRCSCSSFTTNGFCSHSMALQRMLQEMLPTTAEAPAD